MVINWFPGHMAKTLKKLQEEIKKVDAVIYVLDSRAPLSCINPSFIKLIKEKPVIFVLNKADLVNQNELKKMKQYLETSTNHLAIIMNSTESNAGEKIVASMKKLLKERMERFLEKGAKITLKAMIIGVPNSGKSTLANNLGKKAKAHTGNKAGVTKSNQWIKVDEYVEVLDTPGTLWPSLDDKMVAENLAFIGSIKEEVLDTNELAFALVDRLIKIDNNCLLERYNLMNAQDPIEALDEIALKRGFKLKGGDIDYDRVCTMILTDYKKGKLTQKILDERC